MRVFKGALFVLLWLISPVAAEGKRWALLVGINQYQDSKIAPLEYCVQDVQAVARVLRERAKFDTVYVLTEQGQGREQARSTYILERLDQLAKEIGPGDTFLFYF